MKKILFTLMFCIMTVMSFSQVKFMGLWVDGNATSMIQELKKKGFSSTGNTYEREGLQIPILEGTFNGYPCNLTVVTNHKKVYRIYLTQKGYYSEAEIIIHFNKIFDQFYYNDKYLLDDGEKIKSDADISYEMSCHNKIYEAAFYQILSDDMKEDNHVWFRICEIYGKYYLAFYYDNELNAPNGEDL